MEAKSIDISFLLKACNHYYKESSDIMSNKVDYFLGNTMSSLTNFGIGEHRATDDLWRILVAPFLLVLNLILILPFPFILLFYPVSLMMSYIFKLLYRLPLAQWMVKVVNSASVTLARRIMKDERDAPFLLVIFGVSPLVLGSFMWQLMLPEFDWRLVLLHYVLYFGPKSYFYFRVFACKHLEAHRFQGLYKKPYNRFLDRYFEWFLGIFYGNIPEMDRCAHVGIHHVENNNYLDNQSTLLYDRTNLLHFLQYVLRNAYWHNSGVGPLVYFYKNKRWKLFRQMALGVIVYYTTMGVLLWIDWLFTLVYLVLPYLMNNAINAIVSWTWHIFSDPDAPENYCTGTLTIVDDKDDFLYENYHLSHHLNPSRHWTQNYRHYHEENQELYKEKNATVFRHINLLNIFILTTLLNRFDLLAKSYVDLTNQLSHEEIVELLRQRTRPVISNLVDKKQFYCNGKESNYAN